MGVGFAAVPGATACPALEGVSAGWPVEGDLAAGSGAWLDGADAGAVCGAGPARTAVPLAGPLGGAGVGEGDGVAVAEAALPGAAACAAASTGKRRRNAKNILTAGTFMPDLLSGQRQGGLAVVIYRARIAVLTSNWLELYTRLR